MDVKIILLVVAVLAGLGFIANNGDFVGSVFDTHSCEPQKVNISNNIYSSKAELREDVLSNGGKSAWNDIQNNVANWETRNGALYFEPANCDRVVD